jgi:hypothetical protein
LQGDEPGSQSHAVKLVSKDPAAQTDCSWRATL